MNADRIKSARKVLKTEELEAILFFNLPNIRYLCGFTGTDGVLFLSAKETVFLTDSRYSTQATQQVNATRCNCYKNKFSGIVDELSRQLVKRVGFDAEGLTVAAFNELNKMAPEGIEWVPLTEQIRPLRACKSREEVEFLEQAAQLNKMAFEKILPLVKPGISELQIALELEFALKRLGGEANAFDFIVASGKRGALPHGVASNKLLQMGELVTIDFGTRVNGYHSDETVTLAIGGIDGNLRQIFDYVLKAHDLALDAIRPGLKLSDLDAVARTYLTEKGYGEYFGHGLGHGVGLEIHEYPAVSSRTEARLQKGMVITIEPGIYLPGIGGVRIEDTVVVTAKGYRKLTRIPKQFKQVAAD